MKKQLKDICTLEKGKQIDTKLLDDSNKFRYINGGIKESGFYNEYNTEGETVLISEGGASCGYVNYVNEKFWCGCHCYRLTDISVFPKYLFYSLKDSQKRIMDLRTGAAMPNIKKETLKIFEVVIDESKPQQIKIANHLDKIQLAIDNKKQQLALFDELAKSKFVEMFGDPVENTKKWEMIEFEKLGEINRGVSKHRPRGAPELLGGKYPLIQTGDVANCDTYITEYTSTYSELGLAQSKMWEAGCLCITIAANIAKTGILTFDACFPDSVVGFIPNEKVNQIYMHFWFSFFQAILEFQAPQTAQKNLNLATLCKLKICVPPLPLQNKFADFVQKIDRAKSTVKQEITCLQELLDSKMQEYFG